jgi:putative endonuclease
MSFCVYILYSASLDKFYVGYTAQLEERFLRHNQKSKGFTSLETKVNNKALEIYIE